MVGAGYQPAPLPIPAHPELVEGRGGWFDKLTMSGQPGQPSFRRKPESRKSYRKKGEPATEDSGFRLSPERRWYDTVALVHHERLGGLLVCCTAHPELVEGRGGWFDKLTMSGRDCECHYRRDYWRHYRRHSAIFHNSLSQPFTLTPCRVFRRAEARPRCTRGIS